MVAGPREARTRSSLDETQSVETADGEKWINGAPASADNQLRQVGNLEQIRGETDVDDRQRLSPASSSWPP